MSERIKPVRNVSGKKKSDAVVRTPKVRVQPRKKTRAPKRKPKATIPTVS